MEGAPTMTADFFSKRPRSPSFGDNGHPPAKFMKTHSNHLQINYLARLFSENIPLVNAEDTLPSILRLIGDYDGVLQRHESIAGNLGACPLGPILMKRFERLFDGPPRILKSHGKETNVTWLDVVEFARNKPEQFNLEKMRNGVRVCQFYTKQSRVEISEEDYVLIASGMPQKLIPPQPIMEDEEKELSALDILEKNLTQIISLADQVSARARQLNHRLKNRKTAIMSRRAESEGTGRPYPQTTYSPPPNLLEQGNGHARQNGGSGSGSIQSPQGGFTAVNLRSNVADSAPEHIMDGAAGQPFMLQSIDPERVSVVNGTSLKGVSPEAKTGLVKQFISSSDRESRTNMTQMEDERRSSSGFSRPSPSTMTKTRSDSMDHTTMYLNSPSTHVAIPHTPASLLPHHKAPPVERDDGGPWKVEMVARMEQMHRGERIIPPCDRCRRLHMDCQRNLTACMGCTKKHAKCSWRDVREDELHEGRIKDVGTSDLYHRHELPKPHQDDSVGGEVVREAMQESGKASTSQIHALDSLDARVGQYPVLSGSPKTQTYSTEDDDITRAILEEKEEAAADNAENKRQDQTPSRLASPPVSQRVTEHQLAETAANAVASVTPSMYKPFEGIPRPQSSQFAPRPEYNYVKRPLEIKRPADDDSDDDGDRLQKAAAEVYRTASSASARPL